MLKVDVVFSQFSCDCGYTKKMNRWILLALLISGSTNAHAQSQTAVEQTTDTRFDTGHRLLYDVYQPLHIEFAQAAEQWAGEVQGLCEQRTASSVYKLQVQFGNLIELFAAVELFRLGPLLEDNLRNRIFYWPDKRRVGERQLRALLASMSEESVFTGTIANKSVALQGFTALERLFYSAGYQPVEDEPQCELIPVIVDNIAAMATTLSDGWKTDTDISQALLQPSAESKYFRTQDEVIVSAFTQIKVGLDIVLDAKLKPLLSRDQKLMRQTPLWISQRTVAMLAGNVRGLRALLLNSDLLEENRLKEKLRTEFNYIDHVLDELKPIVYFIDRENAVTPRVAVLMNKLAATLAGVRWLVEEDVSQALGVKAGFNSEDGD